MRPGRGLAATALAALCACASAPRPVPRAEPLGAPPSAAPGREARSGPGLVHVVRKGQTLYRIARAYSLAPAELMQANGIDDPRTLEVGQELWVPGARERVDVDEAATAAALPRKPTAAELPPPPAIRAAPPGGDEREAAALAPAPSAQAPLAWPLKGVLYGRYGVRGGARHDGIDIAAPEGSPVLAAADGQAIFVGHQSGYGKVVILRHEQGLVTVYAHNSAVLVREGERVAQGQPVARVGQTGRTTGPHLHFEVREGTRPRNPLLYLP